MSNWNWSSGPAQPGDLLETNVCAHCVWELELRAGIGWLHRPDRRGFEITCARPEPARWHCSRCATPCYVRPNGATAWHRGGPEVLCGGPDVLGVPPTEEAAAFAPYG